MGLTVIEKVWAIPAQALDKGVTVIKVVIGTLEPLMAVNELILPVPESGINPTKLLVFTH